MPTSHSQQVLAAVLEATPTYVPVLGRTPLFVVASPRQDSGKTFIARLAADYLCLDGGETQAFDLNTGDETLSASRPSVARCADLTSTLGQMALFDRLIVNDGVAKVVDVGHASFEPFLALCDEIDFFGEAYRRSLEVLVLFPAEPHSAAVKAYEQLRRRLPWTAIVPVFNDAILKGRKVREQYPVARAASVPLQIPILPPNLMAYSARTDCSFADFHSKLPVSVPIGHAFELRSWTKRTFLEFRELELRLTLEKLRASLKA